MKVYKNKLYYGDCLKVIDDMELCSVDLIYLDPPFNSNRAYNTIYKDSTGRPLPSQINAFCDMWELTPEREELLRNIHILAKNRGVDSKTIEFWKHWMNALRYTNSKLLAYLLYMMERLLVMKGLLKPTGSIYLHCDPTASHYIKVLMDSIFGHQNFRNEIVWCYSNSGRSKKKFTSKHDIILLYAKSEKYYWDYTIPISQKYLNSHYRQKDENGNRCRIRIDGGKKRIYYPVKGMTCNDWWADIPSLNSVAKERLGYPTQKPIALLKRIIEASCPEDGIILDPFCGCGTTICAAHELNRRWLGIDIAYHAIRRVVQNRLQDRYKLIEGQNYEIDGIPNTLEGARDIWKRDKYQFQRWVIEYIDGFVTNKSTGDGGVDGRLFFSNPNEKDLQTMILEVKGGQHINISVVRNLRGAMEREKLPMAGLIVLEDLPDRKKQNFLTEMASAGTLEIHGKHYPRMQLLTTKEILEGKKFDTPSIARLSTGQSLLKL